VGWELGGDYPQWDGEGAQAVSSWSQCGYELYAA
jgi:hypothetical protein